MRRLVVVFVVVVIWNVGVVSETDAQGERTTVRANTEFTVAGWIWPASGPRLRLATPVPAADDRDGLWMTGDGRVEFHLSIDSRPYVVSAAVSGTGPIHIAVTADKNTLTLYVSGRQITRTSLPPKRPPAMFEVGPAFLNTFVIDRALGAREVAALAALTPPARLSVVSTDPVDGTRRVALHVIPEVTFSDTLDPASITPDAVALWDARGVPVAGALTYDASRKTVQFTPVEPLLATRPYTMRIAGGADLDHVRSVAGMGLAEPLVINFHTTIDPPRIAAGDGHQAVIDGRGQLWTWGSNDAGQLGRAGSTELPSRVAGAESIATVAAGARHTLAVRDDGRVIAWGSNLRGQLGIGSLTPAIQPTPVEVAGLTDVVEVAAGLFTSVALRSDGSVWMWGLVSGLGVLNGVHLTPVQVPDLPEVASIAAGAAHVVAQTSDGRVWTWGSNVFGQLGNGTTVSSTGPHLVSIADVVGIAAGTASTLAATADLGVWAWGRAEDGVTTRLLPEAIVGVGNVRHMAAGLNVVVVLGVDGTVKAWGSGAASDGSNSSLPLVIAENIAGGQVAAGGSLRLALDGAGVLRAWGRQVPLARLTEPGFIWKAAVPTFSHPTATYDMELTVLVRSVTAQTVIRYTTDGSDPDELSPSLPPEGELRVSRTTTVKARAWAPDYPASDVATAMFTLKAAAPVFSPPSGIFLTPPTVFISSSPGAGIHVTVDGSLPTIASPRYNGPFQVLRSQTVRAVAIREGWTSSEVSAAAYQLNLGTVAPPVMSPAPGVYEEQAVVSLVAAVGATIHYTTDGSEPGAGSPIYSGPLTVVAPTTIRAIATAPDHADSPEVSGTYRLSTATPVILPGSATYTMEQMVSMTTRTASAEIRYTLDGTDPGLGAPLYAGPFSVGEPSVIKGRTFRPGLEPSAVAVAELNFRAPDVMITPAPGIYLPGQQVALATDAGSAIRYTLDGSAPSTDSAVYSEPFALSTTTTVRAAAYRAGWLAGLEAHAAFIVSTDVTGPTVTASLTPAADGNGWHRGDVTVTFACADADSEVTFCSRPQTVAGEGEEIEILGHGRDAIGNVGSVRVRLKIDRTPPLLSLFAPGDGHTVPVGTASIVVTGAAFDTSGVARVASDGRLAALDGSRFACEVPLSDGQNVITLQGEDLVGLTSTKQLLVHVGEGPPPRAIRITPEQALLGVGEVREPRVVDDRGKTVPVADWSVDTHGIVSIHLVDGVWTLEALAAGSVGVSARYGDLTATARIEVFAAGLDLPPGTVLWTSGQTVEPGRATIVPAVPGATDDPRRTATLFYIDEGTAWAGRSLARLPGVPVVITAVTADGRELWRRSFDTAAMLKHAASDMSGGIVLVWDQWFEASSGTFHPPAVQRLAGASGHATWEYRPYPAAFLSEVATHPDGRTFFTEERFFGVSNLIAVDPSGVVSAWPLPAGRQTTVDSGEAGMGSDFATPALATQPIVTDDGTVVLVAKTTHATRHVISRLDGGEVVIDTDATRLPAVNVDLHVMRLGATELSDQIVDGGVFDLMKPDQFRLLPDGQGGLLLGHRSDPQVLRIDASGRYFGDRTLPVGDGYTYGHEYALGDGALLLLSHASVGGGTRHSSSEVAFDPETLSPLSATAIVSNLPAPSDLRLQFARQGGGIQLSGPGAGSGHAKQVADGLFASWNGGPALVTGTRIARAQTEWPAPSGTEYGGHVALHSDIGIFAKSHPVRFGAQHVSLRIVPRNQIHWMATRPADFMNVDSRGMRFATIGAGPGADDSGAACDGTLTLVSAVNRPEDVTAPPFAIERLLVATRDEDRVIAALLDRDAAYRDALRYCFFPLPLTAFYNSNSYAAGLLRATGVHPPIRPALELLRYPGWFKPVPESEFRRGIE